MQKSIDCTTNSEQKIDYIFFLFGVASTMPILAVSIAGHSVSLFDALFILVMIRLLFARQSFSLTLPKGAGTYYVIWLFLSLFSCLFGFIYFINRPLWQSAAISYIPKIIIYLVFYILLKRINKSEYYIRSIIKGIISGIIINLIWAIIDAVIFYTFGFSITNRIFAQYILDNDIRYGMLSLTINGQIRAGGLNGDPANVGIFAPILAAYSLKSKKYILLIISIISIFASVSLISLAGIIIIYFILLLDMKSLSRKKKRNLLLLFFIVAIIGVVFWNINNPIIAELRTAVMDRLLLKRDIVTQSVRTTYFMKFIPAVFLNPISFLIGTGFGTASYAYIKPGFINENTPYDPECTYFSYYFDCGLAGFIAFMLLSYNIFKSARASSEASDYSMALYACVLGSLVAFWGYHYILYAPVMLITICAVIDGQLKSQDQLNYEYYNY